MAGKRALKRVQKGPSVRRTASKSASSDRRLRVAILGASGYTGLELIRILSRHPRVEITLLTSEQESGRSVGEVHPSLVGRCPLVLEHLDLLRQTERADLFFLALPNGQAMQLAPRLLVEGKKVVDLSSDFRIQDLARFRKYYGNHSAPEWVRKAVYGLCELHRAEIMKASLVANPGCYATAVTLGLGPAVKYGLVETDSLSVFAASGVSGAGRRAGEDKSFVQVNEGFHAYNPVSHRHRAEAEQELGGLAGRSVRLSFIPHLLPVTRGILATATVCPSPKKSFVDFVSAYEQSYRAEPFVRVRAIQNASPDILDVQGTNFCHISLQEDAESGRVVIFSALDNLVKGASGQAVQNMNLMCGFPETLALL